MNERYNHDNFVKYSEILGPVLLETGNSQVLVAKETTRRQEGNEFAILKPDVIGFGAEKEHLIHAGAISPMITVMLGQTDLEESQLIMGNAKPALAIECPLTSPTNSYEEETLASVQAALSSEPKNFHNYVSVNLGPDMHGPVYLYNNIYDPAQLLIEEDPRNMYLEETQGQKKFFFPVSNKLLVHRDITIKIFDPANLSRMRINIADFIIALKTSKADIVIVDAHICNWGVKEVEEFEDGDAFRTQRESYEREGFNPFEESLQAHWQAEEIGMNKLDPKLKNIRIWYKHRVVQLNQDLSIHSKTGKGAYLYFKLKDIKPRDEIITPDYTRKISAKVKGPRITEEQAVDFWIETYRDAKKSIRATKITVNPKHPGTEENYRHILRQLSAIPINMENPTRPRLEEYLKKLELLTGIARERGNRVLAEALEQDLAREKKKLLPAHYKKDSTPSYRGGSVIDKDFQVHHGVQGEKILAASLQQKAAACYQSDEEYHKHVKQKKTKKIKRSSQEKKKQGYHLIRALSAKGIFKEIGLDGVVLSVLAECSQMMKTDRTDSQIEHHMTTCDLCHNAGQLIFGISSDEFLDAKEANGELVSEPLYWVKLRSQPKDLATPLKHRPIEVTTHPAKLFSAAAANEMSTKTKYMSPCQTARENGDTQGAILRMKDLVEILQPEPDEPVHCSKIDFSDAFNAVFEQAVEYQTQRDAPEMCSLTTKLRNRQNIVIFTPNETNIQSEHYYVFRGYRQGDPSASKGFNQMQDQVLKDMSPNVINNVDDAIILAKSEAELLELEKQVEERAAKIGLTLNKAKCKRFTLMPDEKKIQRPFTIQTDIVFGGLRIDSTCSAQTAIEYEVKKAVERMTSIQIESIPLEAQQAYFFKNVLASFHGKLRSIITGSSYIEQMFMVEAYDILVKTLYQIPLETSLNKTLLIMLMDPNHEFTNVVVESTPLKGFKTQKQQEEEDQKMQKSKVKKEQIGDLLYQTYQGYSGDKFKIKENALKELFKALPLLRKASKLDPEEDIEQVTNQIIDKMATVLQDETSQLILGPESETTKSDKLRYIEFPEVFLIPEGSSEIYPNKKSKIFLKNEDIPQRPHTIDFNLTMKIIRPVQGPNLKRHRTPWEIRIVGLQVLQTLEKLKNTKPSSSSQEDIFNEVQNFAQLLQEGEKDEIMANFITNLFMKGGMAIETCEQIIERGLVSEPALKKAMQVEQPYAVLNPAHPTPLKPNEKGSVSSVKASSTRHRPEDISSEEHERPTPKDHKETQQPVKTEPRAEKYDFDKMNSTKRKPFDEEQESKPQADKRTQEKRKEGRKKKENLKSGSSSKSRRCSISPEPKAHKKVKDQGSCFGKIEASRQETFKPVINQAKSERFDKHSNKSEGPFGKDKGYQSVLSNYQPLDNKLKNLAIKKNLPPASLKQNFRLEDGMED
jgi:hypothetical protein